MHFNSITLPSLKCPVSGSKSKRESEDKKNSSFIEPKFPIKRFEYLEGQNFKQSSANKTFLLPCDDGEVERVQVNHLMFKTVFRRLFFSPVEEQLQRGIRVLSVSVGPAWWLRDMAEQYPNSHFTGTDPMMYPISPPPLNCHLRVADATKGLPFPDNSFDYVLQHDAVLKYTRTEWDFVIKEIVRVTKPGGWIELEPSCIIQDIGPNLSIWLMRLTVSLQTRNIHIKFAPQLHEIFEKMDEITDLEYSHRSVPIGWLGKLGDLMLECLDRAYDAMKPRLCEDWDMTSSKYDKIVEGGSKECREFKSWTNIHYMYCRKKPDAAKTTPDKTGE